MRRTALLLVATLVALGACSGGDEPTLTIEDVQGHWWLESWSDGATAHPTPFPTSVVSARPSIRIGSQFQGTTSCNDFRGGPARVENGRFYPGQVVFTAKLCSSTSGDDPMRHERIMQTFLFGRAGLGIDVEVSGLRMVWRYGAVSLHFFRIGD